MGETESEGERERESKREREREREEERASKRERESERKPATVFTSRDRFWVQGFGLRVSGAGFRGWRPRVAGSGGGASLCAALSTASPTP